MKSLLIRTLLGASISAALSAPVLAQAADPITDMKGRWVGKTHTIVAGKGGHWPSNAGTFEKPGLFEKDLTFEFVGQQDTRFWGSMSLGSGNERTVEPMIGTLGGKDKKKVLIADTDGFFWGEVEGDTLSFCYAHAGGPSQSTVVSCTEVKRAK